MFGINPTDVYSGYILILVSLDWSNPQVRVPPEAWRVTAVMSEYAGAGSGNLPLLPKTSASVAEKCSTVHI